jgi:hypothetical protein
MSQIGTVTAFRAENVTEVVPGPTRAAAIVSFVLGFTGLAFWIPALFGASAGEGTHPVAIIQRVCSLALEQYTPQMGIVIPVLGALFSLASALQIPGAVGTLRGRAWGMLLLRAVGYTKVASYIAAGLLLGLALFSSVEANRPSWTFAAINWIASLAMIGVYYWIIVAMNKALHAGDQEALLDLQDDDLPPPGPDAFLDRSSGKF